MKQTGKYLGAGALPNSLASYYPHGRKDILPDGRWYRYIWEPYKSQEPRYKGAYYLTYHVYAPLGHPACLLVK